MPKRGLLAMLAVLVWSVSFCVPARAQVQFGAITGKVVGEDGQPVVGAEIVIEGTEMKANYKVKTDKKGHYYHRGLNIQNVYNVTLLIDGRKKTYANGVRIRGGEEVIDFDLKAHRERAQAARAGLQVGPGWRLTKEQRREVQQQLDKEKIERDAMLKLNQLFADGVGAIRARNYDQAIAQLEKAAQLGPEQPAVFANLGEAYLKAGRSKRGSDARALYEKAIEAHEKTVSLSPDDHTHRVRLGMALAYAGEFQRAEEELRRCAALDPANGGKYLYNLGALLINDGRREEAIKAFRKAAELDPSYPMAWYQLGVALSAEAKVDEKTGKSIPAPGTVEAFQKYLELEPDGRFAGAARSWIDVATPSR